MTTPTRTNVRGQVLGAQQQIALEGRRQALRRLIVLGGLVAVVALVGLYALAQTGGGTAASGSGGPSFAVGSPGPGAAAPDIQLSSTAGGTYDLAEDAAGKTTLLYFQEGIGCQPCWGQMTDIEKRFNEFMTLGIDDMVSITVDDLSNLSRKVDDEGIASPVLSDPDLTLGPTYTANQYGMMGTSTYGHTFIIVGPDGTLLWRADYGGSPNYTMYVEVDDLLEDVRAGLAAAP